MSKTQILARLILLFEETYKKIPNKKQLKSLEEEANILWSKECLKSRVKKK